MAKFRFKLQSVLNIKARLEEQQKLQFAAAKKQLDEEEEKLANLYGRKEGYEEEARRIREEKLVLQDILDNETAIIRIKEYIDDQTVCVQLAENRLEDERRKLVEIMRERKTYERLREKAFDEFLREEDRAERLENDERSSFVYGEKQLARQ